MGMTGLSGTMGPSPFALSQTFDTHDFSTGTKPATVTLVWPKSLETEARDLLRAASTGSLGRSLSSIRYVSVATTAQKNFLKVVASGSEEILRLFLQQAALRNLAAERVVWS